MSCSTLFQYLINHLLFLRFCNALKKEHYFLRCGQIFFWGGSPRCGYVPNNSRFFVSWKIPKKANMPAVYAMQPESIHFREALGAYDSCHGQAGELMIRKAAINILPESNMRILHLNFGRVFVWKVGAPLDLLYQHWTARLAVNACLYFFNDMFDLRV